MNTADRVADNYFVWNLSLVSSNQSGDWMNESV